LKIKIVGVAFGQLEGLEKLFLNGLIEAEDKNKNKNHSSWIALPGADIQALDF
jgi:hypothetical protein